MFTKQIVINVFKFIHFGREVSQNDQYKRREVPINIVYKCVRVLRPRKGERAERRRGCFGLLVASLWVKLQFFNLT